MSATSLLDHALGLAGNGWAVLPLGPNKLPRIGKDPRCRAENCGGGCGREGHGVKDATTDAATVTRWWHDYPGALIGARVPAAFFVLDIDPRHNGQENLTALESEHGVLPETLTVYSGRGDGGRHLYFLRPAGKLTEVGIQRELRRLGQLAEGDQEAGIDLKAAGYCVMPPSPHPLTGDPYVWDHRPPAEPPAWLRALLAPVTPRVPARPPIQVFGTSSMFTAAGSIADDYRERTPWSEILEPHGWRTADDGDSDGSRWRHPSATTPVSATVRHGCLFVYSPNTPFEVTADGDAHGYTKFRAYAVLNHAGNLSTAAKHLRAVAV